MRTSVTLNIQLVTTAIVYAMLKDSLETETTSAEKRPVPLLIVTLTSARYGTIDLA